MSLRYKGAVISATPPTTTGGNSGTAPGAWTLQQQMQAQAAGTWPSFVPIYIEDVFSTWLYTGNGSTQTITNGIDLSTYGGMVWRKQRNATYDNIVADTVRGQYSTLFTNTTAAASGSSYIGNFSTTGFDVVNSASSNPNGSTNVSWTFRKQPKFFDVVTYTGNGVAGRTISHSLGSVPGCIIVKRTDFTSPWPVYHRSIGATQYIDLNDSSTTFISNAYWNNTTPTSTVFTVGANNSVNANGGTYVAYLFAHDAGGFGLTGTDNVISCGTYTANGIANGPTITLGYEPQWIMIKNIDAGPTGWVIFDSLRGLCAINTFGDNYLYANATDAEANSDWISPTATGFKLDAASGDVNSGTNKYIYIAIRRGPMKTPTTGTSVFGLNARTGTGANATVTGSAGVSDAVLIKNRGSAVGDLFASRLTGTRYLETSSTAAEVAAGTTILQANPWDVMDGVKVGTTSTITNASSNTYINYLFDRAPGFFDVVCYTGTGAVLNVTHNLRVAPEFMIIKNRTSAGTRWAVYYGDNTSYMYLDITQGKLGPSSGFWNNTSPTSSVFTVGVGAGFVVNNSGDNYVAYLFATCAGVSKVGSYTGTGTTKQIDCGFTGGARFVLIKRTDSTGDWYVWDSARGIVVGNDPYLLLNSTAAEVTNTDYVDTYSAGFEISSTAPAAINANGGTFIFLAIA